MTAYHNQATAAPHLEPPCDVRPSAMTLTIVPTCPQCGKTADQVTVRDISETVHLITACHGDHLWETKWFAAERSA